MRNILILMLFVFGFSNSIFSQDSLTRKTKSGQFTLKYFLYSHKSNYLKFSAHCDCFQMHNDSIFFVADERVSLYKGWDFSKYTNLSIGTLINDLNKHFLLINYKIHKLYNQTKIFSLSYYYYKDTNTYYELHICLDHPSIFESKKASTDIKKAIGIKDYGAYIEIWDIDYNIESAINFYQTMKPEKGSDREKHNTTRIEEAKKLKKKIDEITKKIKRGKIVLPSDQKK